MMMGPRRIRPRAWAGLALRWALGLAVILWLITYVDVGEMAGALKGVSWVRLLPVVLGLTAIHAVGASAWRLLTKRMTGQRLGCWTALRAYYAAQAMGSFTPSNIGADAYRVYAVAEGPGSWSRALGPVVAQRMTSLIALVVLGIGAVLVFPLPVQAAWLLPTAFAVLTGMVLLAWSLRRTRWTCAALNGPLASRVKRIFAMVSLHTLGRSAVLQALLLGLVFHAGSVVLGYGLVQVVLGDAPLVPVLAALTLARLVILAPVSVSGLGLQEGALAVLFPMIGLSAEAGLMVSLLTRLGLVATIAVGAVMLLVDRARAPSRPALSSWEAPKPDASR